MKEKGKDKDYVIKEFGDILFDVTVELARKKVAIGELLQWEEGHIVKFNKTSGEAIDILVNNKPIAYGEIIVLDDKFGVRFTDVYDDEELLEKNKEGLYDW
ncbi:MAG: FliM/FliN family flagellar motor switch protein [Deferribacterota bacterium]|nr:FliM/FliN family flagellar motor switch protein [Deferribacterota bacterium]